MLLRGARAILSQLQHIAAFSLDKRRNQLRKAALIMSIDVDVGDKLVAERNKSWRSRAILGSDAKRVHTRLCESEVGAIEEIAIPCLLDLFEELEVPVTFAIRGQLTETNSSLFDLIKRSSIKHEIGAHGYYHRTFTSLSRLQAEDELRKISIGMRKFSVEPRSFVFPKNKVVYLDLLEKYGYKCYRGCGGFGADGMYIRKHGNLYDIHPSFYLGSSPNSLFLNRMVNISILRRTPLHFWFHPSDLGSNVHSIRMRMVQTLRPLLVYASQKNQTGELTLETMYSAIEKLDRTG
jgi:hypothetical protein